MAGRDEPLRGESPCQGVWTQRRLGKENSGESSEGILGRETSLCKGKEAVGGAGRGLRHEAGGVSCSQTEKG